MPLGTVPARLDTGHEGFLPRRTPMVSIDTLSLSDAVLAPLLVAPHSAFLARCRSPPSPFYRWSLEYSRARAVFACVDARRAPHCPHMMVRINLPMCSMFCEAYIYPVSKLLAAIWVPGPPPHEFAVRDGRGVTVAMDRVQIARALADAACLVQLGRTLGVNCHVGAKLLVFIEQALVRDSAAITAEAPERTGAPAPTRGRGGAVWRARGGWRGRRSGAR